MGDHDHCRALSMQLADTLEASALESLVANREDLINHQDFGVHVDGYGEAEPGEHPRGVRLYGVVDEPRYVAELDDLVQHRVDVAARQAMEGAVEVDVL